MLTKSMILSCRFSSIWCLFSGLPLPSASTSNNLLKITWESSGICRSDSSAIFTNTGRSESSTKQRKSTLKCWNSWIQRSWRSQICSSRSTNGNCFLAKSNRYLCCTRMDSCLYFKNIFTKEGLSRSSWWVSPLPYMD